MAGGNRHAQGRSRFLGDLGNFPHGLLCNGDRIGRLGRVDGVVHDTGDDTPEPPENTFIVHRSLPVRLEAGFYAGMDADGLALENEARF